VRPALDLTWGWKVPIRHVGQWGTLVYVLSCGVRQIFYLVHSLLPDVAQVSEDFFIHHVVVLDTTAEEHFLVLVYNSMVDSPSF